MKKIVYSLLLMFSVSMTHAQIMWQINKDTVYTWYYQDGDEFNGTQLDRNKWNTSLSWGRAVMSQDMYFTDGNDLLEANGVLKLSLNKRDYNAKVSPWEVDSAYVKKNNIQLKNDTFPFKYTAGLIWSKEKYKYGYFEIRFKCPKNANGMWPAFWTFGGNKNDEIDFFEMKCEKNNYVHVDVHCPNGCSNYPGTLGIKKDWGGWIKTSKYLDEGYNTISGEWANGYIKWYLNGKGIAYFKGTLETSMHLIANMSIAKDGGAFSPGPDETTIYPGSVEVDYIRVWGKEKPKEMKNPFAIEDSRGVTSDQIVTPGNKSEMSKKKKFLYGKKTAYKNDGIFVSMLRDSRLSYVFNIEGINSENVSIVIKDSSGKEIISKENCKDEFIPVNMSGNQPGKYLLTINYNGKVVNYEFEYN